MNRFTIHCTEEQTKKALELGAPIEFEVECPVDFETWERSPYPDIKMGKDGEPILIIPTAEQMLCWLEEQGVMIDIIHQIDGYCLISVTSDAKQIKPKIEGSIYKNVATLAAIDTALDFLENNR